MILLVISDLHIDTGGKLGTFGWKAKKFMATLDAVIEHYGVDKVVLNGDVFDLYKYTFAEIAAENPKIISYFSNKGFIILRGNHDIWIPHALNHYHIRNSKGQSIHIEHGHKADFLNGTSLGRTFSLIMYAILKLLVRFRWAERTFFRAVHYFDDVDRVPRKYNTFKYLVYALKLLKKHDMVILGHTHKLESHKIYYLNHRKIYLNSGTCSLGRFQAVLVDTETLEHETIKIGRKSEFDISLLPDFKS